MRRRDTLAFAAGVLILGYILYSLDPQKVAAALLKTRPEYFILAAVFYLGNEIISAAALRMITSAKISIFDVLISHMCGMLYANATPGRVGYYYTSFSIAKKTGTSRSGNIGILTLFQGMNFLLKVVLCITAVFYFSAYITDAGSQEYLLIAGLFPIAGLMIIAVALYTKVLNNLLARLPKSNKILEYVGRMQETTKQVRAGQIVKILAISLLGWMMTAAQWFFLAMSMDASIDYTTALMLQPILTTVMFVPLSPSGLGLAEGGSALLFKAVGLTLADGVAFMLLVRINSVIVDAIGLLDIRKKNAPKVIN
jgi:hypothetical protein